MILVVGSGIAGLWTALSLARGGQSVTLVTKGSLTDSNTWFAQGGVAAALEAEDTLHFQDTLDAGAGLCDPQAVKVLVEEGPLRVRELMEAGFLFDREGDRLALGLEGAHSRRRILHAGGDATGARIEDFLARSVRGEERITLLEKFPVYSLLKDEEKVWGVVGRETLLADA
nr:L-aspartate oxidase [Cyanobacteria bacterium UBA8530]